MFEANFLFVGLGLSTERDFLRADQEFATLKAMFRDLREGKMSMEEVGKAGIL